MTNAGMLGENIPSPEDDTSAHNQAPNSDNIHAPSVLTLENGGISTHFDQTLDQLVGNEQKRFGSQALFRIVASYLKDTNDRQNNLLDSIEQQNQKFESSRNMILQLKEENATLKAERKQKIKYSPLIRFSMFAGLVLFSLGLDQIRGNFSIGLTLLIIGTVFVLISYFVDTSWGEK